jgi:hypothetical protein
LTRVDERAIGAFGLIGVYPVLTFAAVAVLLAVFVVQLRRPEEDAPVLGTVTAGLALLLIGAPALIESAARFPVAWLHATFSDYIMQNGQLATDLDARFSWPGFFTGSSALTDAVGASSAGIWLVWAPLVAVLASIPLLVGIGRATLGSWRAIWTGTVVFLLANWVGQDYFAPQSLSLVLYLAIMVVLLTHLRTRSAPPGAPAGDTVVVGRLARLRQSLSPELEPAELALPVATRVGLILLVGAAIVAMTASHALTPIILIATLAALAFVGRLRPWPLALVAVVAVASWLSVVAEPFWSGHSQQIFGAFGRVDVITRSGLTERVVGSDAHLSVVTTRIQFSLAVWGLAALAVVLGYLRRRLSVPLLVLAGTPIVMVLAGDYGGEGFLRMYLFSLVGCSMLIGSILFWEQHGDFGEEQGGRRPSWLLVGTAGLILALVVPQFLVTRYGNESFERLTAEEIATSDALADMASGETPVVPFGPGGSPHSVAQLTAERRGSLVQTAMDVSGNPDSYEAAVSTLAPGTYVLVLRQQIEYTEQNFRLPATSVSEVTERLVDTELLQVVFSNEDGTILQRIQGS